MSWIIRSRTTATSVPRGLNWASLCDSTNIGLISYPSSARIAGLNRSMCPTWIMSPFSLARRQSCSASAVVSVIGFSRKTCLPASSASQAAGKCALVLVAIVTASTPCRSSWRLPRADVLWSAATLSARFAFRSYTPTRRTFGISPSIFACKAPRCPTPMTPILMVFTIAPLEILFIKGHSPLATITSFSRRRNALHRVGGHPPPRRCPVNNTISPDVFLRADDKFSGRAVRHPPEPDRASRNNSQEDPDASR